MAIGVSYSSIVRPIDQGWSLHSDLAGVSYTTFSRQRHPDQKPRHLVTFIACAGGLWEMQGLRVCTVQCAVMAREPVNLEPKHGLQGFQLAIGGAVSKNVWFCFLEARFPLFLDSPPVAMALRQHQFVHSRRESCIIAAASPQ